MSTMLPTWLLAVFALIPVSLYVLKRYLSGARCLLRERLDGKVVVVTGCNTGIGFETAGELARRGARVIMACRNIALCHAAREKLFKLYGLGVVTANSRNLAHAHLQSVHTPITSDQLLCEELDLASLASIRRFAKAFLEKENAIHILVNNAGISVDATAKKTSDGFEQNLGVNYLGHFLLTALLHPALRASGSGRVINVSSHSHYLAKVNTTDLAVPKRGSAYANSKLAQVIHAKEISRRWAQDSVTAVSLHPGLVMTEFFRNQPMLNLFFRYVLRFLLKTPWEGAQTSIYCCLYSKLIPGGYYSDCHISQPNKEALNEETCMSVWRATEKLLHLDS